MPKKSLTLPPAPARQHAPIPVHVLALFRSSTGFGSLTNPAARTNMLPLICRTMCAREAMDMNELDNLLPRLLECLPQYDFRVREEGVNPSRSRRCKWGRNP
jgi:hypothetical protein